MGDLDLRRWQCETGALTARCGTNYRLLSYVEVDAVAVRCVTTLVGTPCHMLFCF